MRSFWAATSLSVRLMTQAVAAAIPRQRDLDRSGCLASIALGATYDSSGRLSTNTIDGALAATVNYSAATGEVSSIVYNHGAGVTTSSTITRASRTGAMQSLSHGLVVANITHLVARPYYPGLGRFLSVDPVEGGTPNDYVYPTDPINNYDRTSASCSRLCW